MRLSYRLSIPDPASHLIDVEITISGIDDIVLELSLPVWTPGSYLVREYAQHIERFSAYGPGGGALHIRKKDKNTWILPTAGLKEVHVQYTLYAFDPTVRTNFADAELAVIIGAATFMYVEGAQDLPVELTFSAPAAWKDIATASPRPAAANGSAVRMTSTNW